MKLNEEKTICKICGREFRSYNSLIGHMKVHKPDYENQKQKQRENSRKKAELLRQEKERDYFKNPKYCEICGNILSYKQAMIYKSSTCSRSCSTIKGNKNRDKMSDKSRLAISKGVKKFLESERGQKYLENMRLYNKKNAKVYKKKLCPVCGKEFNGVNKTCSSECRGELMSRNRMKHILKNGSSNISSKYILSYKGLDYRCDSKLEIAGVIFMIEHLGFKQIKRFKSILSFKDDEGKNHRYNPDFICYSSDDVTTIVEIKQDITKTSSGDVFDVYKSFLDKKKETLRLFAEERNYKWMWITPSYSLDLRRIYRNIIKGKSSYNFRKIV